MDQILIVILIINLIKIFNLIFVKECTDCNEYASLNNGVCSCNQGFLYIAFDTITPRPASSC